MDLARIGRSLPGVSGSLLPSAYLATLFEDDARDLGLADLSAASERAIRTIWRRTHASTGPASAPRLIYDLLAEPLLLALGFRIRNVFLSARQGELTLATKSSGTSLAALILPWATAPSMAWRDLVRLGQSVGAAWGLVVAPPFVSVVRLNGGPARRSLDFDLSRCVPHAHGVFGRLLRAEAFESNTSGIASAWDDLVARAAVFQERVRHDLQRGVAESLRVLTSVVTAASNRSQTDQRAQVPTLPREQALTIVYRILFLLFAESRDLVPTRDAVYRASYSVNTLARHAHAGASAGCWDALGAMTRLARIGCRTLTLEAAPFNGRLFARTSAPVLEQRIRRPQTSQPTPRDQALSRALVALTSRPGRHGPEHISYRDLGVEQLGAVYERLLDEPDDRTSRHGDRRHGIQRKQTGTFYTPQSLADFIVRRTLAPLTEGASSHGILSLRIVDPSMGSGACLVAACRYLAGALERAYVAEGVAADADFDDHERANLRRHIAERCLFGVDRNPTAVELARLSLWLCTLARGRPLGFLDHRLRVGDSLVGAWPADLSRTTMRTRGTEPCLPLLDSVDLESAVHQLAPAFAALDTRRDHTIADVHAKTRLWRDVSGAASPLEPWRQASSMWCARWFWPDGRVPRPSDAEARALIDAVLRGDTTLRPSFVTLAQRMSAQSASSHRFFHWPLEFPSVFFDDGGRMSGGFDAVIGNPPWEMLRRDDDSRRNPSLLLRYVRESGQYPSCTQGHLNLYQAFLDRSLSILKTGGRLGLVLPWGLASDDGAAPLRHRLLDTCGVDTLVGLDNARGLFPIHRGIRFVVVTATHGRETTDVRARFGVSTVNELENLPAREEGLLPTAYPIRLTRHHLRQIGGPLLRFPDIRRVDDLAWLSAMFDRFPRIGSPDGWNCRFGRELNATESRPHCSTDGLIVVEGKHVSPFVVAGDGRTRIAPDVLARIMPPGVPQGPRLAYRDVSGVGNMLTLIAAIVPADMVTTHTLFCLKSVLDLDRQHFLCALLNSYVLNSIVRLLMGGHVTTTLVEGLPAPVWTGSRHDRFIATAARQLASGRAPGGLAARLQAAVARLYGLTVTDFTRVLDGFPLVPIETRTRARRCFERTRSARPGTS